MMEGAQGLNRATGMRRVLPRIARLMVVLCGERDTQRVVNTGTLYR